jgi:diketogulonate reductase-like aldo/keto reductase
MAYCPLGEGRLLRDASLATLADRHGVTPASIALAWLLSRPQTIAIPKTSKLERLSAIAAALDVELDKDDLAMLDHEFPPPDGPQALSIA